MYFDSKIKINNPAEIKKMWDNHYLNKDSMFRISGQKTVSWFLDDLNATVNFIGAAEHSNVNNYSEIFSYILDKTNSLIHLGHTYEYNQQMINFFTAFMKCIDAVQKRFPQHSEVINITKELLSNKANNIITFLLMQNDITLADYFIKNFVNKEKLDTSFFSISPNRVLEKTTNSTINYILNNFSDIDNQDFLSSFFSSKINSDNLKLINEKIGEHIIINEAIATSIISNNNLNLNQIINIFQTFCNDEINPLIANFIFDNLIEGKLNLTDLNHKLLNFENLFCSGLISPEKLKKIFSSTNFSTKQKEEFALLVLKKANKQTQNDYYHFFDLIIVLSPFLQNKDEINLFLKNYLNFENELYNQKNISSLDANSNALLKLKLFFDFNQVFENSSFNDILNIKLDYYFNTNKFNKMNAEYFINNQFELLNSLPSQIFSKICSNELLEELYSHDFPQFFIHNILNQQQNCSELYLKNSLILLKNIFNKIPDNYQFDIDPLILINYTKQALKNTSNSKLAFYRSDDETLLILKELINITESKLIDVVDNKKLSLSNYIKDENNYLKLNTNQSRLFSFFKAGINKPVTQVIITGTKQAPIIEFNYEQPKTIIRKVKKNKINNKINNSLDLSIYEDQFINIQNFFEEQSERPFNLELKIKVNNTLADYMSFVKLIAKHIDSIDIQDQYFINKNFCTYLLESLKTYSKALSKYEIMSDSISQNSNSMKNMFSQKESEIEAYKDKIDKESLKQVSLLEDHLNKVKENIFNNFGDESMMQMRVKTRFLQNTLDQTQNEKYLDDTSITQKAKM